MTCIHDCDVMYHITEDGDVHCQRPSMIVMLSCAARLSYGESANDSLSLVTNRITPKTEKPLQTHTHTLTHTNTPHTHSLTFPYIYRRFFEQRRHYCHRYLFRVLCGQCYCYQFHYSLRFLHDLRSRKVAIQLTSSHQCLTLHLHLQPR